VRRVKCDETKPACLRCVRAGRACDGYNVPSRPADQLRAVCPRPLTSSLRSSDTEHMALDFFRRVTVSQLPCASVTETPWEKTALDLMHLEPSIAAAASACAGIHRAITDAREHNQWRSAMQQYSKSLSLVGKYIGDLRPKKTDDDVLVVLIACLLFFTFEVFSGQDQRASLHLQIGLQITHERCRPSGKHSLTPTGRHFVIVKPRPNTLLEALVQVFVRQKRQGLSTTGHSSCVLSRFWYDHLLGHYSGKMP
jgi:hypothetical protein